MYLQNKDIVNIVDGKNIGSIIDVIINNNGEMEIEHYSYFEDIYYIFSGTEEECKIIGPLEHGRWLQEHMEIRNRDFYLEQTLIIKIT